MPFLWTPRMLEFKLLLLNYIVRNFYLYFLKLVTEV